MILSGLYTTVIPVTAMFFLYYILYHVTSVLVISRSVTELFHIAVVLIVDIIEIVRIDIKFKFYLISIDTHIPCIYFNIWRNNALIIYKAHSSSVSFIMCKYSPV